MQVIRVEYWPVSSRVQVFKVAENTLDGKARGTSCLPMMTLPIHLIPDPQGKEANFVPRLHPDTAFAVSPVLEQFEDIRTLVDRASVSGHPVKPRHGQLFHPSHSRHAASHTNGCIPAFLSPRLSQFHPSTSSDIKGKAIKKKKAQLNQSKKGAETNLSGAFILADFDININ